MQAQRDRLTEPENVPDHVEARAIQIRRDRGYVRSGLLDLVDEEVQRDGMTLASLRLMQAIDIAADGFGLRRRRPGNPMLAALLDLWEDNNGNVQLHGDGQVLRKGAVGTPGSELGRYFANLTRIAASDAPPAIVKTSDQMFAHQLDRAVNHKGNVRIAFNPTLVGPDDVHFDAVDLDAARLFSIGLESGRQATLAASLDGLVSALEERGVNLAVLPESVLTIDAAKALQSALRRSSDLIVVQHRWPRLQLVAVGVAAPEGSEGWLLAGDGTCLIRQPKINPWTLSAREQISHGLTKDGSATWPSGVASDLPGDGPRRERLTSRYFVESFDCSSVGRISLVLCEDLKRAHPSHTLFLELRPTIAIGLVLDGDLDPPNRGEKRWAWRAAQALADEPGALVVVGTSLTLHAKRRRAGKPVVDEPVVGLVFAPGGRDSRTVRAGTDNFKVVVLDPTWLLDEPDV